MRKTLFALAVLALLPLALAQAAETPVAPEGAPAVALESLAATPAPAMTPWAPQEASNDSLEAVLAPERMACSPPECGGSAGSCPAGFRCLAKCCVPR